MDLDEYVYIITIKGMYGIKQADILAYNQIISHMEPHKYHPVPFTTVLWTHKIIFILLMYGWLWSKIFFQRWCKSPPKFPKKNYAISTDWDGRNYLVLTIDWNSSEEYVEISMPDYVRKALDLLQHTNPKRPQYAPHLWSVPYYVKRLQMAPDIDEINLLDKNTT